MKGIRYCWLIGLLLALSLPATAQNQRTGVEVWAQTCGNCHINQPAARYTAERWESIMTHMKIYARITDEESDAVLQFLQGGAKSLLIGANTSAETAGGSESSLLASAMLLSPNAAAFTPEEDFSNYCVACHGAKGKGNGPAAVALTPRPADLTDPAIQEARTDEDFLKAITDGKGSMPGFKAQLTAEQIQALVGYIRTLKKEQ
ncbi:MAG: c-type cytochrome [Rhodothermales bacterium]